MFFYTMCLYMLYRIFWEKLQGRLGKTDGRLVIWCAAYVFLLILSTIFAQNQELALWGGYQRFEGLFVKLGYLIVMLYTYFLLREKECRMCLPWERAGKYHGG